MAEKAEAQNDGLFRDGDDEVRQLESSPTLIASTIRNNGLIMAHRTCRPRQMSPRKHPEP